MPGSVVLLEGNLGAGKTVFAQGVAQGLQIDEPVTSPTFALIKEYQGRLPLYHIDLYRIAGDLEASDLGIDEYLYGEGVTLVEWAGRAPGVIPDSHLKVAISTISDTKRSLRMTPSDERYETLLRTFRRSAFGM